MLLLIGVLFASIAEARVVFSGATPLSPRLQEKVRHAIENRCNVQGFSVIESRTLISNQEQSTHYFSTFATMDFGGTVVSKIEVHSQKQSGFESIVAVQGPLCH